MARCVGAIWFVVLFASLTPVQAEDAGGVAAEVDGRQLKIKTDFEFLPGEGKRPEIYVEIPDVFVAALNSLGKKGGSQRIQGGNESSAHGQSFVDIERATANGRITWRRSHRTWRWQHDGFDLSRYSRVV